MTRTIRRTTIAALALAGLGTHAMAGERVPTNEEAAAISAALQGYGFSTWSKVELDEGKWEIDNAKHADGKVYDVDLKVADLSILKKELED